MAGTRASDVLASRDNVTMLKFIVESTLRTHCGFSAQLVFRQLLTNYLPLIRNIGGDFDTALQQIGQLAENEEPHAAITTAGGEEMHNNIFDHLDKARVIRLLQAYDYEIGYLTPVVDVEHMESLVRQIYSQRRRGIYITVEKDGLRALRLVLLIALSLESCDDIAKHVEPFKEHECFPRSIARTNYAGLHDLVLLILEVCGFLFF